MGVRQKIKSRRKQLGLTQTQVGKRIGLSRPAYANLENGYRPLKPHLARIAKALGLRV